VIDSTQDILFRSKKIVSRLTSRSGVVVSLLFNLFQSSFT
jgi:hypothetical protein